MSAGLLLLASLLATPLIAQSDVYRQDGFEGLPTTPTRPAGPPPIPLRFEVQHEVSLPGPLLGSAPHWSGDKVLVELGEGMMQVDPTLSPPTSDWAAANPEPPIEGETWVEDSEGRFRYRTRERGLLVAEKRCKHCRDGWRRAWKLRIAGATVAPPLVLPNRVCLGTLGNQIYCVKPRRGFRLWTIDVEDRLSSSLVGVPSPVPLASGKPAAPVILALPDAGDALLALDGATGLELARLKLDEQERLVGGVLTTPEGLIVVVRQGYSAADARLVIYRLESIDLTDQTQPAADPEKPLNPAQLTAAPR
jgi:hypothetical protein